VSRVGHPLRRASIAALAIGSAAGMAALSLTLLAQPAALNPTASSIVVTFRQENVPVDAPFRRFSGQITFDPAHPMAAHATLQVATASLDLGSPDYNAEVQKPDWLSSAAYPNATFVSSGIAPGAAGHFTATGTFTLKGRSQTLAVPVTVSRSGSAMVFDGTLQISRGYFSVGSAEWKDVVDDAVKVHFHLVQ
jgi:polyisoprenoid-binding protein YceI